MEMESPILCLSFFELNLSLFSFVIWSGFHFSRLIGMATPYFLIGMKFVFMQLYYIHQAPIFDTHLKKPYCQDKSLHLLHYKPQVTSGRR
jgi:hypothetical protein